MSPAKRTLLCGLGLGLLVLAAVALADPEVHDIRTKNANIEVTVQRPDESSSLSSLLSSLSESADSSSLSESSLDSSDSSSSSSASSSSSDSSESGSSSFSSSESGSSESGEFTDAAMAKLTQFLLPPEPAAARGYRPIGDFDDSFRVGSGSSLLGDGNGVVEAVEAPIAKVVGPTFVAQGLGDLSIGNGFLPVRDTQTLASGSCVNPPCSDDLVIVRQIDSGDIHSSSSSSSSSSSAGSVPASSLEDLPNNGDSCGCDSCPCEHETPEERRAKKLEALERRMRSERSSEKEKLEHELEIHQHNLGKIEAMARALRYQYSRLREHHNILRNHISANKQNYDKLGGDNPWKGTDLDIEGREPTAEGLDDIGTLLGSSSKHTDKILDILNRGRDISKKILDKEQKIANSVAKDLLGKKVA